MIIGELSSEITRDNMKCPMSPFIQLKVLTHQQTYEPSLFDPVLFRFKAHP